VIWIACFDLGNGATDGLDRKHAMPLQPMTGRFLGHFDCLQEQVDPLASLGGSRRLFDLMNEVRALLTYQLYPARREVEQTRSR